MVTWRYEIYSVRQWPKISIFGPAGKTMRSIQKWLTPPRIVTTFSIRIQSLGTSNYAVGCASQSCRSENWCLLYVTLGLPARGGQFKQVLWVDFDAIFSNFFIAWWLVLTILGGVNLRRTTWFSLPSPGGATIFATGRSPSWIFEIWCIMLLLTEFRVNRAINRRDIAKNDFQYGSRPPYWICCDVMILHPCTLYYVPDIVLNFHLDWFNTFWYTWSLMFHHFGWKLAIQGQICRVLGVNRGHISIFHFITRKGTSWRDFGSLEPLHVKIRPRVSSLRWTAEKVTKSYIIFTHSPGIAPWTDFYRIWNKHSSRGHNQSW